jgi:carbamoyl-phosphate synthase large subunit
MELVDIAARFKKVGYTIFATGGTARVLMKNGVFAIPINKIEAESPNILDLILDHHIDLVIDTPSQGNKSNDGFLIRRNAIETGITVLTSLDTANALATSLEHLEDEKHLTPIDIATISSRS